jgi:hypothetical protein
MRPIFFSSRLGPHRRQSEQIHARAPVDATAADYRGGGAGTRSLAFGEQNGPLACLRCRDSGQHAGCATADNQNVDLALSGHPGKDRECRSSVDSVARKCKMNRMHVRRDSEDEGRRVVHLAWSARRRAMRP